MLKNAWKYANQQRKTNNTLIQTPVDTVVLLYNTIFLCIIDFLRIKINTGRLTSVLYLLLFILLYFMRIFSQSSRVNSLKFNDGFAIPK